MAIHLEGETPLSVIGFTNRVYNNLMRNGVKTAEAVLSMSKADLMGLYNFKTKLYAQLHGRLAEIELIDPNEEDIVLMPEVLKRNAEGKSKLHIYILAQALRIAPPEGEYSQQP